MGESQVGAEKARRSGRRALTPDDEVRRIGKRRILVRPDERTVSTLGPWELAVVDGWTTEQWTGIKLIRNEPAPKNVWYLSHSPTKGFSQSRDWALLQAHHEDVALWAQQVMTAIWQESVMTINHEGTTYD